MFVTAGSSFDPAHPALADRAIVLTTARAVADIRASVPAASDVVAVNDGAQVNMRQALGYLHERGYSLILSEGGPRLLGSLLAAGLVDELFLTVSPLLAGRSAAPRLSLVEGVELLPEHPSHARLRSVRRHGDHLFLRYAPAN